MASRDPRPDPQLENAADTYNSFGTIKMLRVRGLLERNQYRSQTKATSHAIPSSPNAIISLPPQQAGGIVNLGKDVSREQRACHQASLGEAAPRVSPQRQ